jgi:hypothetical protein
LNRLTSCAPAPALRGGSWINDADNAAASYRNRNQPDNWNNNIGLRVVLSIALKRNWLVNSRGIVHVNDAAQSQQGAQLLAISSGK